MPDLSSDLRKLKALSGQEWIYLGYGLALLPLLRIGLKLCSFQFLIRFLEQTSSPREHGSNRPTAADGALSQESISTLVRMVTVAANRGPVKANCLPRSLATWWLLRRRGLECELRLGVKPRDEAIQAHAWVEFDGRVLNGEPGVEQQFSAFERVAQHRVAQDHSR